MHRPSDLERQARTRQIQAAARKGRNSAEIADLYGLTVAAVERMLAPAQHSRVSDPIALIQTRQAAPGMASADVQLYWLGFLTAAGHIRGYGSAVTLVVTLGENTRDCMEAFQADLTEKPTHCEFCHSSIVGWQAYLRDRDLCNALFPWGIPSDLHGADPALVEDLPPEFVSPFVRGYVDGNWISHRSRSRQRGGSIRLQGTPAVLAGINLLIQRYWQVFGGVVTDGQDPAELCFTDPDACRIIQSRLNEYASRFPVERVNSVGRR